MNNFVQSPLSTANLPTTPYIDPSPRMLVPNRTTATGYFDKPADKRLRPWVLLGSLLLACIGIGMIITTFTSWGALRSLWGIFSAGVALAAVSLVGIMAALTLRPGWAKMV